MTTRAAPKPTSSERRTHFRLSLTLTTRAARDVLGLLPAANGNGHGLADADAREHAATALAALLGADPVYDVYLRNGGVSEGAEQVVELRLATDTANAANNALLDRLGGKALLLVGTEKEDRYGGDNQFLLFNVRAIPAVWGQKDAWSQPARVSFEGGEDAGFPMRLLAAVARLPEPRAQRESLQRRLADWHRYLGVLERTARARQFSVAYKAFKRSQVRGHLVFTLDTAARNGVPWDKLRSAVDEPLEVRERRSAADAEEDNGDDWLLGDIVAADEERGELTLALDEDVERLLEHRTLNLPRAGTLVYKASGDLAQIRRLKFGLEMLEQGYGENPRLGEFLFDVRQARLPNPDQAVRLDRDQLLQPNLNPGQVAAVEGALNAPDLFLIQGPPGTGKTTVIAEICYQNALRGQRTLIASQSNLAVDNALSRLVHHPRIRALRRGRADRVEVEGAPFIEGKVVGTWLAKTAEACDRDLAARRERIRLFEDLLKNRPRLEALAAALERYQAERPRQAAEVAALEARIPDLKNHAEQLNRSLARRTAAREGLARLAARYQPDAPPPEPGAAGDDAHELGRWFDHPVVERLRLGLDELNAAFETWGEPPILPAPSEAGAPVEPLSLEELLALSAAARRRATELGSRLAASRAYMDEWHQTAMDWYRDRAQGEALNREHAELVSTEAALRRRHASLLAQRDALEAQVAEWESFDAAQAPTRAALRAWLDNLLASPASPMPGPLNAPPEQFASPLGRALWATAGERAQLHRLAAQALEVRTCELEAQRLADLAVRVSSAVERLAAELPPQAAERQPETPRRGRGRRSRHDDRAWTATPLGALVAYDARGGLHPAPSADTAWLLVEAELARVLRRPTWLGRLLGESRQRQRAQAEWLRWLPDAAAALVDRRAELESLARHKAARLQDKFDATCAALEAALAEAAQAFGPEAQARLEATRKDLAEVERGLPALVQRLEDIKRQLVALGQAQERRQATLQAAVEAVGSIRPTRHFSYLLRQLDKLPQATWHSDWQAACAGYDEAVRLFMEARAVVDPLAAITAIAADVDLDIERIEQSLDKARHNRRAVERDLETARARLKAIDDAHAQELDWWHAAHAALPERLRPPLPEAGEVGDALAASGVDTPEYVRAVLAQSEAWAQALEQEKAYLARAANLVSDWARRLRQADEQDRADLQQIYIDNANVIGITCVQAGAYAFSREYRNFDCVIIDEVSKATPPELLLPMLKGARVVLVGDHKQLPPMIGPESLEDLAIEMGVPRAELAHLERSLFKELFEAAPPALRVMLTEQYRMHPQIMDAINQFYAEQLTCGLPDPDRQRAHGFDLSWLRPEQHLLWLNTPTEGAFAEQRVGTTYLNAGELDVIERLVKALDAAWAAQVARGQPPKEVGVITFYGAQVRELKERLLYRSAPFKNLRLRVGTVDRFQGMERPVIIASLVRNNRHGNVGFARKPERVNVAFSRAQELLVIVGSRELFCERARDGENAGEAVPTTAIYGRVAEVVQRAGGLRRTGDVAHSDRR